MNPLSPLCRLFGPLALPALLLVATGPQAHAMNPPTNGASTPAGPTSIALSWNDHSSDESGFEIERQNGAAWDPVATTDPDTTHYYDRGLLENTSYTYRVRAIDGGTPSTWLDLDSATTTIRMNLVFFLADDMGYKDIVGLRNPGIDGASIYETPAIDSLIDQSLVITNAYCSGPRCVVARRCVLTGNYDWRPDVITNKNYYLDNSGDPLGGGIYGGGVSVNPATLGQTVPDNATIGDAVGAAGYRTCYIGKYHLGQSNDQPARGPAAQGFDVAIASGHAGAPVANATNGLSYFPDPNTLLYQTLSDSAYNMGPGLGLNAPAANADEYLTDRLTNEAIGFINDSITNHSTQPFFVTLAHYAVHTPAEAKPADIAYFTARKSAMASELAQHPAGSGLIRDYSSATRVVQDNRVYAAMMKSYDDSIASIRTHLAATPDPRHSGMTLAQTTILVVTSDHGGKSTSGFGSNAAPSKSLENDATDPVNPGNTGSNTYSFYPTSNYPLRQGKTWVYEGGLKIPLIIHYPGLTTTGTVSNAFVHGADFFATFADMAGAPQQPAESRDSVSFMLSVGQPEQMARHDLHHFFTNSNTGTANPALGAYRKGDYKLIYYMIQRRTELYNLAADPYERNDLSPSRPDLAEEMLAALYEKVLEATTKMPKPSSNSWQSEQKILTQNAVIPALPTPPDGAPSGLTLTQKSDHAIELTWTVNATNATHSAIYRSGPDERAANGGSDSYREIAYLPIGQTTFTDRSFTSMDGENYKYRVESENLGGWNGWTIDPSGHFSDGSTNHGTTNTGNKILTLSLGAASQATSAADDTITTVPGETRDFNPLLNDSGNGPLTISAITQPSSGSATTNGHRIVYLAPEGFSGSITMTYTISDGSPTTDTATVTFTLPVAPPASSDLASWEFNDAPGTPLESAICTTGLQFGGPTTFTSTNGSDLVLSSGAGSVSLSEITGQVAGAPLTSTKIRMEFRITSLDFTASSPGSNNASAGFALRDSGAGKDFGILRIREQNNKLRLEIRSNNSNNLLHQFDGTTLSDLIVSSVLDLVTKTFSSQMSVDGGSTFTSLPDIAADPAANSFDVIRAASSQIASTWVAPDAIAFDYLRVSEETDSVTLYDSWSTAYPWNGVLERDADADPDLDGLVNLLEFAFGSSPTSGNHPNPISAADTGFGPAVQLTPIRDTSLINYTVLLSTDLLDWTSIAEVPINTPAGVAVEVALPAGERGFGRVRVTQ